MSILEQLWSGEISVFERRGLKTKEYRSAMHRATELEQQLRDLLGTDNRKLLEEFERASDEAWILQEQDAFATGVSFGVQVILDALQVHNFGSGD